MAPLKRLAAAASELRLLGLLRLRGLRLPDELLVLGKLDVGHVRQEGGAGRRAEPGLKFLT